MSPSRFTGGPHGARTRRIATRRGVSLPCQAVRERDFRLVADRAFDVSVEGMLLPVSEPVLTGEAIIVSFEIPGTWIDAEAIVTRVVHGRRPEDDGLAVGIAFEVLAASSRAALAGFLHGRPPPLPRRGPLSRLRRGMAVPRLADHEAMAVPLPAPFIELDPSDLVDAEDDHGADVLGVLRAVAGAWQSLVTAAP